MAQDAHTQDQPEDFQFEQEPPAQLSESSPAEAIADAFGDVTEANEADVIEQAIVVEDDSVVADDPLVEDTAQDEEPESRLLLEPMDPFAFPFQVSTPLAPPAPSSAPAVAADYLPLFVAPQPVSFEPRRRDDEDSDDADDADEVDDAEDSAGETDDDDDSSDRPANRRRRRGRRGRGRGRGEQNPDDPTDGDSDDESGDSDSDDDESDEDDADDDDNAGGEGGNRRRRRRRRRKSGTSDGDESASPDDPPNTVVHERAPRAKVDKSNEIQGISGSTRLEAKRQRRRDGRDAGRRRPPILSEAEFLARREAVERVMVVRDKVRTEPPHEGARYTQIAVLEDGVVVEHFVTSAASASLVGNVYLGIVQNVLPSMEAAFVDIGRGRNGVLYAGEVNWEAAGLGGAQRKIEQALKPGDYVVVQVSKDPVGHKGARLTTQVSLAGRYLVYVPGASSTGISRKLPDTERQRLKEILREVVPADAGVIIRTASEGVKEDDIRTDVNRLQERWTQIEAKATEITGKAAGAAVALYEEPDVLVKVIRDLFNEDFSGLIVSGDDAWKTIDDYVTSVAPELLPRMTKYEPAGGGNGPDVFAVHRIDEQLTKALDRKVYLPSGGTLVIDRTEAMTVVDVNTGKFTGSGGNLEQTVTRNNLEAAEEVVRQLRLRDIGGIIVVDFIDMVLESNRDLVLRRLTEALARDRTRHQVSEVTSLGLVQLTRKKLGTGLIEAFSTNCTHCNGRGIVIHGDPVDSGSSNSGRKAEPGTAGGRRGKRGKKGAQPAEAEVAVAKVPVHGANEHPMFKAMAAANGRHEDDDTDGEVGDDETLVAPDGEVAESVARHRVPDDGDFDETDDAESDDESDDDEDDTDEENLDVDDDENDIDDDDIEVIGADDDADDDDDSDDDDSDDDDDEDDEDSDEDSDDDSDDDEDEDSDDDEDDDEDLVAPSRPRRRRAAARPAGPPAS